MRDLGILFAFSTILAYASGSVRSLVETTSIASAPAPWEQRGGPVDPAHPLRLGIALSLPEITIESLALSVSDPSHTSYGAHLSQAALQAVLAPSATATDQITSWLESSGAQDISLSHGAGGSWIHFHTTVSQANRFLCTNFESFTVGNGVPIIRSLTYSVPAEIAELVDFIHPITHFPRNKPEPRQPLVEERSSSDKVLPRQTSNAGCLFMTPSCLAGIYHVNYAAPANETSPSRIGVAGFDETYPNHANTRDFLETYGMPANRTPVDFTIDWINFPNASSIPVVNQSTYANVEGDLDTEFTMALTNPMATTYFYTYGRGPQLGSDGQPSNSSDNEPYLEFLNYFLSLEDPPQVLSISSSDDERTVPFEYAQRVCALFGAVAARGVSVLMATGDGGAAGGGDPAYNCTSPDGSTQFGATFPTTCPYVTAVGGSNPNGVNNSVERAWLYSTGGFSNYFPVPDWQINATSSYISKLNGTYDGFYNKSGRAIPDITLSSVRYPVTGLNGVLYNYFHGVEGTSASTPTLAGMIALLNDERLRKGMSSLGWLNPLIYSDGFASAWNDVVNGNIAGCNTDGFPALPGWDAASGVGSVKFDVLRSLVT